MELGKSVIVIVTGILALAGMGVLISRAATHDLFLAELFVGSLLAIFAVVTWVFIFRDTPFSWMLTTFYFSLLLVFILFAYFHAAQGLLIMTGAVAAGIVGQMTAALGTGTAEGQGWQETQKENQEKPESWYDTQADNVLKHEEPVAKNVTVMPYSIQQKTEPKQEEEKSLGMYLASRIGKKFHLPDCGWTQRMSAENMIWLKDRQDALERNLEPCYCVK